MEDLNAAIRRFVMDHKSDLTDDLILTSARQNETLLRAIAALHSAVAALESQAPHEMVLLDLYGALAAINELTGEVVTEDILGRIFSTFCIGK
jgi:tRNA modification GTPase